MRPSHALPGEVAQVFARRVLVLAPHFDDDVLGCGGLLARLAAADAEVRVLFLTDSSGGVEVTEETEDYAARRREEATRSLDSLGITDLEFLDTTDGALADNIEATSEAIRAALLDLQPELLFAISPLETTADHQAAFAALYRVLSPLRGDSELDSAVTGLRILLYEINHPAFPNVLVDVSDEISRLTTAIEHHRSQLELHNYLEAALGIRRYRALSLPPSVKAAEGYRELAVRDFTTHSLADLIRSLGGVPEVHEITEGPPVSVVVRTKDRPQLLAEALASLAAGSYRKVEIVLVNDGGEAPSVPEDYPFSVVRVELPTNQGRAAAANAGVEAATGDYVAFLDDDDLAAPEHLSTLARRVAAADVRVAYTDAAVGVYELDGGEWLQVDRRLPYSRDFDPEVLLFDNYIPFNTLLIERSLLEAVGPFDPDLPFFEDWDLLIRLAEHTQFQHLRRVTCEYRHFRGAGHHVLGERPTERADFLEMKARVIARHSSRHTPELIARVVDRLRSENVTIADEFASRTDATVHLQRAFAEIQGAYHRLNGERDSLIRDRDAKTAECERHIAHARELELLNRDQAAQEKLLREVVDDQEDHLKRLYAEIERLGGIIEEMEGTQAWRWHRRLEQLRGRT